MQFLKLKYRLPNVKYQQLKQTLNGPLWGYKNQSLTLHPTHCLYCRIKPGKGMSCFLVKKFVRIFG